jgi:hypothetical protein
MQFAEWAIPGFERKRRTFDAPRSFRDLAATERLFGAVFALTVGSLIGSRMDLWGLRF